MTMYNWITIAGMVIGWAVTYGKLCQKLNELERRQCKVDVDIEHLRLWGEAEIGKATAERNESFVRKDVCTECMNGIVRRLDILDALEIGAQLAEIKAMLIALKEQLKQK